MYVELCMCAVRCLPSQAQAHPHSGEAVMIFHILPHGHLMWPHELIAHNRDKRIR